MDCPPKKMAVCREVAIVERWLIVEVRLYEKIFKNGLCEESSK